MTQKIDLPEDDAPPSFVRYMSHLVGWSVLFTFVLIGSILVIIALKNIAGGEPDANDWPFLLICTLVVIVTGWLSWRWRPDFTMGEPMTARGNRVRKLMLGIVAVGILTAVPLILADAGSEDRVSLFSNGPVPQFVAVSMIAMWLLALPLLAWFGRSAADEHAKAAKEFGSTIGLQIFMFATPVWWIGWRGGLFPRPDVMLIFVAVSAAMTIANLWKRSNG